MSTQKKQSVRLKTTPSSYQEKNKAFELAVKNGANDAVGIRPGDQKGISGPGAFSFGDLDAVNIFNGNLTLKIPIGLKIPVGGNFKWGLSLHYFGNLPNCSHCSQF